MILGHQAVSRLDLRIPALLRVFGLGAALLLGLACALTDNLASFDQQMRSVRDSMHERPATGDVAIVEIDAKSLAKIDHWPWPRSIYARTIDALRAADVERIAFDVDFSARSTPAQDRLLADALRRAGGAVALPTFVQDQSNADGAIENLPAAPFRDHAFMTAVNIHPDASGIVRDYPYGVRTGGVPRPSIAAVLADRPGTIGKSFTIDQSIDPSTIPRFSVVDLIGGRVPASSLRGKRILIGATAIELGDRYAVPRHGVVPGVVIQAMATETLLQGRVLADFGPWLPLLIATGFLIALFRSPRIESQVAIVLAAGGALFVLALGFEMAGIGALANGPALATISTGASIAILARIARSLDRARFNDADTSLGNIRALEAAQCKVPDVSVAAVRIGRYGETASLLGNADTAQLIERVADRLRIAAIGGLVYRVEDNGLAWAIDGRDPAGLPDQMAGLAALLRTPFEVGGRKVDIGATLGLAAGTGRDAASVALKALFAADTAAQDGAQWRQHSDDLDAEADWNMALLGEIDQAIANGDIWVAFQPKLSLRDGAVTGAEALVRWQHPTRGAIPPDRFIPIVEESGDVLALTLHVLRQSLRVQQGWAAAGHDLGVAVNVSANLLRDPLLVDRIAQVIRRESARPDRLTLEVTESASMADPERAIRVLERLRDLGVRLSIDDYGTGQSTLSYLKRVPAQEIKIDKSFVQGLSENRSDQILVRSTIQLAHELGFQVVAEGIENQSIADDLRALGCDTGQGYHFGRPMQSADFLVMLGQAERKAA